MKNIRSKSFGTLDNGKPVSAIILENENSIRAVLSPYGATLVSLDLPDKQGNLENVILGYDNVKGYVEDACFFGCTVGRYANRIARGEFELNGKHYSLACNDGQNHLHGGKIGLNKILWQQETQENPDKSNVVFSYLSPDGEEGYPGNLDIKVVYTLNEDNELVIDYTATTDQPTPVNLTNHAYWNLRGAGRGSILDHVLLLHCNAYLPVDSGAIPTGIIQPVAGSPFDFTSPKRIGDDIEQTENGYDHCYVINESQETPAPAAMVHDPSSGRTMEITTTKPGIQLYTGNFLDGVKGADGAVFNRQEALCLETQFYPDSINQPAFPSPVLNPGETYNHKTVHRFSTRSSL